MRGVKRRSNFQLDFLTPCNSSLWRLFGVCILHLILHPRQCSDTLWTWRIVKSVNFLKNIAAAYSIKDEKKYRFQIARLIKKRLNHRKPSYRNCKAFIKKINWKEFQE